jgi:hypothetical protein
MSIYEPIRKAPAKSEPRRPIRSIKKRRKKRQEMTFTTPKNPVIRRLFWPAPTREKICGASMELLAYP